MAPKWPSTIQGQMYPIYVLLVSMSTKFHSVSLYDYDQLFLKYKPFWKWMDPKWSWTLQGQLYPIHVLLLTSINESQMSGRITLRPSVLEISALNDPTWHWTLRSQRYLTYVLLMFQSLKFHPIILYDQPLRDTHLSINRKCPKWPQNDFEHTPVKVPYIHD